MRKLTRGHESQISPGIRQLAGELISQDKLSDYTGGMVTQF